MSIISRLTTWSDNQVLTASAQNGEFNNILNDYNGGITNANIASGAAIATSKINATFPSGTIIGDTDTQTLSNKTLTKPIINGSVHGISGVSGTSPTLDCSAANIFTITLSGNTAFAISNVSVGQVFLVEVKQGSGTTYTNTWFSTVTWVTSGATAPVQTTTSNGYTVYGFRCTGSNTYLGYLVGTN